MSYEINDTHLTYVGHQIEHIPPWLVSKHGENTSRMDLSFNRLNNINGLGEFTNLTELILDNNELDDDIEFHKNERLQTLTMNKNKIKSLDKLVLQLSHSLPNLSYLSLLGNEACPDQLNGLDSDDESDYQRYRYYVVYYLPKLKFLDFSVVTDEERKEAERVGAFMRKVQAEPELKENECENDISSPYNPLPSRLENEGDHKSSFGKCRYTYYGKQSEGNRFIVDNDL